MSRIRVAVVDDHPLYRKGLMAALSSHSSRVEVVGEAAEGAEALLKIGQIAPDVVLMDIRMRGMDGIEATKRIRERYPRVQVIALSAHDDDGYVLEMLKAGAAGYLLKDADGSTIVRSIEAVHRGEAEMHPSVARKVIQNFAELARHQDLRPRQAFDGLSEREVEVLELLARGKTNREIASLLCISERTVDNHVRNIYSKLNISDRSQAILYAIRKGLVPLHENN